LPSERCRRQRRAVFAAALGAGQVARHVLPDVYATAAVLSALGWQGNTGDKHDLEYAFRMEFQSYVLAPFIEKPR
jgi:hypothetical protein